MTYTGLSSSCGNSAHGGPGVEISSEHHQQEALHRLLLHAACQALPDYGKPGCRKQGQHAEFDFAFRQSLKQTLNLNP